MSNYRTVANDEKSSPLLPILAIISIIFYSLFPPYAVAAKANINTKHGINQENKYLLDSNDYNQTTFIQENAILPLNNTMPAIIEKIVPPEPEIIVKEKRLVTVTAYSSTVDQTDSTPFITANGTHVHDGTIAANFLKFGTKVRFPSIYADKIFIVEDRMKSNVKMDIWFPSRQEAKNFGVKRVYVEVLQ